MPTGNIYESPEDWKRLRKVRDAWIKHYMAKGCSKYKAEECARRKYNTLPPRS